MLDFYLNYKNISVFNQTQSLIFFKINKLLNKFQFIVQKKITSKLFQTNFNHLRLFLFYKIYFYKIIIKKKNWKVKYWYLTQFQQYIY